jgi:outer membrane receptor protein involved in Fe transport
VNDQLQNIREQTVKGVDIEAGYAFDIAERFGFGRNLGELDLKALITIYDEVELTQLPGQAPIDLLGFAGGSTTDQGYIERQGNFSAAYRYGPVRATWNTRYVGEADMSPFLTGFPKVDAAYYHNLRLSYDVGEVGQVYVGGTNLFDEEPPFFASGASGTQALDTIPGYYDVFGRQVYAGFQVNF